MGKNTYVRVGKSTHMTPEVASRSLLVQGFRGTDRRRFSLPCSPSLLPVAKASRLGSP